MASSKYTKASRTKLWIFRVLDWICLFAPVIIYMFIALCSNEVIIAGKMALVGMTLIAAILSIINIIAQKRLRCPIWIILIGLYIAMQKYLLPLVIILAVTSILDDLVFTPLISYYRSQLISNKAIDKRFPEKTEDEAQES